MPVDQLTISGPALAALLQGVYTQQRPCDGLLLGELRHNLRTFTELAACCSSHTTVELLAPCLHATTSTPRRVYVHDDIDSSA